MKTFFFSFVVFFFCFISLSFAQISNKEKPIVPYNKEIGDWDFVIPIDSSLTFDDDIFVFIYVNGGPWKMPGEITEKGIELIHPSELFLRDDDEYDFSAIVFTYKYPFPYNLLYRTKRYAFNAPKLNLSLDWEAMNYNLKTEVHIYSKNFSDFSINPEGTYFYTNDFLGDSIIRGSEKKFLAIYKNNTFFGEKEIPRDQIAISKQSIGFHLRLDNDIGQEKLRGFSRSVFFVEGCFITTNNLVSKGAVTIYTFDNKPRRANIYFYSGKFIGSIIMKSDEPYWLPESAPSGIYYIAGYVPGFTIGEIVKADY